MGARGPILATRAERVISGDGTGMEDAWVEPEVTDAVLLADGDSLTRCFEVMII